MGLRVEKILKQDLAGMNWFCFGSHCMNPCWSMIVYDFEMSGHKRFVGCDRAGIAARKKSQRHSSRNVTGTQL